MLSDGTQLLCILDHQIVLYSFQAIKVACIHSLLQLYTVFISISIHFILCF